MIVLCSVLSAATAAPEPPRRTPAHVVAWRGEIDWAQAQAEAVERLSGYLAIDTVNPPGNESRGVAWLGEVLDREGIAWESFEIAPGRGSLIARLPATAPGPSDPPGALCLLHHIDVVPSEADRWSDPASKGPLSGAVADGYVWGRGALDMKGRTVGLLEAVELLVARGYAPRRTVLIALGHDEETGGKAGAATLAQELERRGVKPWFAFDEGGAVITDMLPGIDKPVALVGVAEKGYATVELSLQGEGGHSNMPASRSTIGRLGEAVARLEADKFPTEARGSTGLMLDAITPHTPWLWRLVLANRWLFDPFIAWSLGTQQASNASVRTTTAVTRFDAGVADNVVASRARAIVNFRLLPGDSVQDVLEHVVDVIDDSEIEVRCAGECREATPRSDIDGEAFALVRRVLNSVYPDAVVAPYLVIGGTDVRYYQPLTEQGAFRFLPVRLSPNDRARMHGTDERIAIEDLRSAVQFYALLVEHAAG